MPPSKTVERLRRLLAVVPYIVAHPGTKVTDLAKLFDAGEADLLDDLNLLFMTGLPPYGPGDLVEVDIDDESRVWIRMADHFSRPVRLTRTEGLALYLRGTELLGSGAAGESDALASGLGKLEAALGPETLGELQADLGQGGGPRGPLEEVREAVAGRRRLEIEYYSGTSDEITTRRIDPEHVLSAIGNWYVVAWDSGADAERLFRVDRIRRLKDVGETFEPRGLLGQGRDLYTPSAQDVQVRLRLLPGARWVAEYYVVDEAVERDGGLEVALPTKNLTWVAKLVMRLGGHAEVLAPTELRDLTRQQAKAALARYG